MQVNWWENKLKQIASQWMVLLQNPTWECHCKKWMLYGISVCKTHW